MLKAYINYPNPHITIHADAECPTIQQQHKQGQRVVELRVATLSAELERFAAKEHRFAPNPDANDMWLNVEFGDPAFEWAVIEYVRRLLRRHYTPFARIKVDEHCQAPAG